MWSWAKTTNPPAIFDNSVISVKGGDAMEVKATIRTQGPEDMKGEVERFFEHLGRWKRPVFFFEKAWKPLCDVMETDTEIVVVVELAGVSAEDVSIVAQGSNLVISGTRNRGRSSTTANSDYYQMEISYGSFERIINLPVNIDAEGATANYDEGFLEVRLPKMIRKSQRGADIYVPKQ
ncbi:MAG: Hsp20/alpha crystallin family protein [Actinobacteria bacterium]|nr:Hsp20/alpha crystallin family protein [Actinomycetota bacterium]